jgi:hypothetical protein
MKMMKHLLVCMVAVLALSGGLGQSAYAAHGKHGFSSPRGHYRAKKNEGQFGGKYMAPKKQRRPTGYYRSIVTGRTVYGKPNP